MSQTLFYNIVVDCGERTMKVGDSFNRPFTLQYPSQFNCDLQGFTVSNYDKFRNGMEQVAAQMAYIRDKLPDIF